MSQSWRLALRQGIAVVLCVVWSGQATMVWGQSPTTASKEGVVHAASYIKGAGICDGQTHPVYIRLEPNPAQRIQVGFFESSAGAVGPQWRTAGWMAAFVAATLLGRDLHSHRISYTLEGQIDGPSAGALTTSGLLALMRGERIPHNVSMTGTVNPDGTIGPVGGIPQKIMGAARSGKKRFAIPLGQRRDQNICTGNEEDVIALGRSLGLEVAEVGDIREAYAFLTGRPYPAAASTPVATELPADIRTAFRQLSERWMQRYTTARQIVAGATPQELTPEFKSIWQLGARLFTTAQAELTSGHEAAAFNRFWLAVLNAEVVSRGVLGMRAVLTQGFPGLHATVQQHLAQMQQQIDTDIKALQGLSVSTSVDAGAVALMGGNLAAALTYIAEAQSLLQRSITLSRKAGPNDHLEVALLAFQALGHATIAVSLADIAVETRGWLGRGGPPLPTGGSGHTLLESALSLYRSAALSNLAYVDALITQEIARDNRVDLSTAQGHLRRHDLSYLAAQGALAQHDRFPAIFGPGRTAAFAQLGALLLTVSNASLLVAQHYSLEARTDKLGRIVGFGREAAVVRMSELADQESLRAMSETAAVTAGASTPMLAASLDAARRNRDVSVTAQDRMTALSLYWNATLIARLITQLSPPR